MIASKKGNRKETLKHFTCYSGLNFIHSVQFLCLPIFVSVLVIKHKYTNPNPTWRVQKLLGYFLSSWTVDL